MSIVERLLWIQAVNFAERNLYLKFNRVDKQIFFLPSHALVGKLLGCVATVNGRLTRDGHFTMS